MSILMIIFVAVFLILFAKNYFEVQLESMSNLNDNVFTLCNIMH